MTTKKREQAILGWHFCTQEKKLAYGDGRAIEAGAVFTVPADKPLRLCKYGLHGARRALDALTYAPGDCIISRVELYLPVVEEGDKLVCYKRRHLWIADAQPVLRKWARWCALQHLSNWNAPDVVKEWVKTGNDKLRYAAESAAWSAVRSAAESGAWSAAKSAAWSAARYAAEPAAWYAARFAAESAAWATTRSCAWATTRSAAWATMNEKLEKMLLELAPNRGCGPGVSWEE